MIGHCNTLLRISFVIICLGYRFINISKKLIATLKSPLQKLTSLVNNSSLMFNSESLFKIAFFK